MKSWETLLRSIYRAAAGKYLQKIRANSLEIVLKDALVLLDPQTLEEIKGFVIGQQTSNGGFSDKGGRSDIYYSLFGFFVSEALGLQEVMPALRKYTEEVVQRKELSGIHLSCALILYSRLVGNRNLPPGLSKKMKAEFSDATAIQSGYSHFLNLLTCYYLEDYSQLYKIIKAFDKRALDFEMPCPVTAANLIVQASNGLPADGLTAGLVSFYRNDGSFSALRQAPMGDLLSTGVALYALRFVKHDLRIMKPECLEYVDSLYANGGFCATVLDPGADVEYTFYGLLALGALAK
jgi:hypothetical protein